MNELEKLLTQYEKEGMKSIILDVRQNPGGFLTSAIDIANLFVEEGKPIVQVKRREENQKLCLAEGGKKYNLSVSCIN